MLGIVYRHPSQNRNEFINALKSVFLLNGGKKQFVLIENIDIDLETFQEIEGIRIDKKSTGIFNIE